MRQASDGKRGRICPILYRPVSVYLLLGAESKGSGKGTRHFAKDHSHREQRRGTERANPRYDLRAVLRRKVCNACDTVG